jgi:hypothetical protein
MIPKWPAPHVMPGWIPVSGKDHAETRNWTMIRSSLIRSWSKPADGTGPIAANSYSVLLLSIHELPAQTIARYAGTARNGGYRHTADSRAA